MYLLDTNVVSELRRPRPHGAVVAWFRSVSKHRVCVAASTIGEIQAGIERTRDTDVDKASQLEGWLEEVLASNEVLPMDASAFRIWARLMHRKSRDLDDDAMIAATALLHDLTIVTRNVRDFGHFGVRLLSPFEYQQPGE